jgi:hypothetical protein
MQRITIEFSHDAESDSRTVLSNAAGDRVFVRRYSNCARAGERPDYWPTCGDLPVALYCVLTVADGEEVRHYGLPLESESLADLIERLEGVGYCPEANN